MQVVNATGAKRGQHAGSDNHFCAQLHACTHLPNLIRGLACSRRMQASHMPQQRCHVREGHAAKELAGQRKQSTSTMHCLLLSHKWGSHL